MFVFDIKGKLKHFYYYNFYLSTLKEYLEIDKMSDLGKSLFSLTKNLADLGIQNFPELSHQDDNSIKFISSKDFQRKNVYSEEFNKGKNTCFPNVFFNSMLLRQS